MYELMIAIIAGYQYVMIFATVFVVAFLTTCVIAFAHAYAEVKTRPREPMEWCSKHGYFRKGHALQIPGTKSSICPSCYMGALASPDGKNLHLFRTIKETFKGKVFKGEPK